MTHDHVLQSTLGQPAVEEHGNEDAPYRGPEDLRETVGHLKSLTDDISHFIHACYVQKLNSSQKPVAALTLRPVKKQAAISGAEK